MSVLELLQTQGIDYKPSGKDYVVRCLNPDHEDRNPSMRIDSTTGIFNCLSCGFSGSLFQHYGETPDWLQIKRNRLKDIINDKLVEATGLSIPENAVQFASNWRGISKDTMRKFEAFQHNNPEFIGRIVFPIRDIAGKILAFCGRHQSNGDPKYLFYPPKAKIPLFPPVKPIKGSVILVEGIVDMLNLHDKGLTNTICAFGVNTVTKEKINMLKIQGVSCVHILFDNDSAGQNGADKLLKLLDDQEVQATKILLDEETKDPGELTASEVIKLKENLYGVSSAN